MVPTEQSRPPLPDDERYGGAAIAFHWSSLVLVIVVGVLGLLHDSWSRQTQGFWINIHVMIGLFLFALTVARLWWRALHPPPPLRDDIGLYTRRLSGFVHGLLYALLFVLPIIGIVTFVWHGRVFDFGLFQFNPGVRSNRSIFRPTEDIHGYLAYALFTLAGLHALAALWHHMIRGDSVLRRMWPGAAGDR